MSKDNRDPLVLSWSGGKDSSLALYELKKENRYEVVALMTTVTEGYDRVSMHGVRRELLEAQAKAAGIALSVVFIPRACDNQEYERRMAKEMEKWRTRGVSKVAFADIFLEDLRAYREEKLARAGMEGVFPLWKRDTAELAREFIRLGFKAVVTCVDSKSLPGSFAGRLYDRSFLKDLPSGVDPCGENGEFHSFVFDGPVFNGKGPVRFKKGEVVLRENRFYFCDLVPG